MQYLSFICHQTIADESTNALLNFTMLMLLIHTYTPCVVAMHPGDPQNETEINFTTCHAHNLSMLGDHRSRKLGSQRRWMSLHAFQTACETEIRGPFARSANKSRRQACYR